MGTRLGGRAIQNSDADVLRETAAKIERGEGDPMSAERLKELRENTRELMEFMKQVS